MESIIGFPAFYGANWNAWIDCMSYLDDVDAGMSSVHVHAGEQLAIELTETTALWKRCPDVIRDLLECTAAVNERFVASDSGTRLMLTFLGSGAL